MPGDRSHFIMKRDECVRVMDTRDIMDAMDTMDIRYMDIMYIYIYNVYPWI